MKYQIEVRSLGYENHTKTVDAPSLRVAKQSERQAKLEWCDLNAIDLDDNFEMPFTRITKLSPPVSSSLQASGIQSLLEQSERDLCF